MKKRSLFKSLLALTAILSLTSIVSSCKKNDVDETGTVNLKVVNASPTSTPQSFYVANKVVVQGGLEFGEDTGYTSFNSGNNLEAQFRIESSGTAYATGRFDLDNGGYYTAFLAGEGQQARVKIYKDDLTAVSGKAKVRFVHLSDGAPAQIDVRNGATQNLAVNLSKDNVSAYVDLDPGVLSLQVFATGQNTSLGTFNLAAFQAGKIYTVYITGSTSTTIAARQTAHN